MVLAGLRSNHKMVGYFCDIHPTTTAVPISCWAPSSLYLTRFISGWDRGVCCIHEWRRKKYFLLHPCAQQALPGAKKAKWESWSFQVSAILTSPPYLTQRCGFFGHRGLPTSSEDSQDYWHWPVVLGALWDSIGNNSRRTRSWYWGFIC